MYIYNISFRLVQRQAFNLSGLGAVAVGHAWPGWDGRVWDRRDVGPMSSRPRRSEKWLLVRWKTNASGLIRWRSFVTVFGKGGGCPFPALFIKNQRLFLDENLYLYVQTFCFLRHPSLNCWTAPSLTPAGSPPPFVSSVCWLGSRSMFALFSLVHTFSPHFLIYVKLGLVGPRGTLFVSFIHPVNKNSSLMPERRLTDDSQKWSRLFKPSSVYGLQATMQY